jgi:hypothetical protein
MHRGRITNNRLTEQIHYNTQAQKKEKFKKGTEEMAQNHNRPHSLISEG